MKNNNLLIKICVVFLTFARLATVIGMAIVLYFGIFENTEKYFTVEMSRENFDKVEEGSTLEVKAEYQDSIKEAKLESSTKNYIISFNKSPRTLIFVVLIVVMVFSIYFIHLLLQFVKSALGEDFFCLENVTRVRMMGFILVGLGAVHLMMNLWISYIAGSYFELDTLGAKTIKVSFSPDIFSSTIFVGLIVLVVAQAFDHGLKLKEDKELTI
ncbi:DUF2975 domain-containing protein [Roseivirga echinicomitans]|uniref:DUF2975 domain-containing protein n=1 Tax=Roseivirga echinicomitans TaxID=296218 RepID=A0A150XJZ7_9BACT|nr:DUF2975 domain-containing protein [Roseivirga echinicomitans]KYG78985.1 hypothetical protein AWN68_04970 [Roseivirga echinicomitans]